MAEDLEEKLWSVFRLDDNNNVFLMRVKLPLSEADEVVKTFTDRKHHQTYWVEEYKEKHGSYVPRLYNKE